MSLIMPNRRADPEVDVTSTSNSHDMRQYDQDVFAFEESSRQRVEDGLLRLPSFNDGDHNLENLKLNNVPKLFYEEINSSMSDWEAYMHCKEHEVLTQSISNVENLPDVRSSAIMQYPEQNSLANSSFSCSKIEIRSHEDVWTDDMSEEQKSRKKLIADAEKGRGNVAYKAADYIKACEHYSNSISAIPLKEAYNNRAQANIKLENYSSALLDLNEVLKQDPLNVKALNRRAICRYQTRLYHEALCDLQSILELTPKSKEALSLMADVKREIAALKGRKYRMRSIADRYKTFEVDVSQLPAYAEYEGNYIFEADKMGCAKTCVCDFCIPDDQYSRYRTNTLRIKERPRWRRLTSEVLKELRLDYNATVTNTTTTSTSPSATVNHNASPKNEFSKPVDSTLGNRPKIRIGQSYEMQPRNTTTVPNHSASASRNESSKNEYTKLVDSTAGSSPKTSTDRFYEKQLRDKNLVNAAYNSSKLTNATVISTAPSDWIALPAASSTASPTKFMKDSQNLSHQRAGSIENAMQKLQLEPASLLNGDADDSNILINCSPALLKKKFDSRLNQATLTKLINDVCMNFESEEDWPVVSQYLRAISELERFNIIIAFIDMKTRNGLIAVFDKAIDLNLENAAELKCMFFSS